MTIEETIIKDADGWDGDHECLQLYNGILQVDTKIFNKGDKIACATFLYSKSMLQLFSAADIETGHVSEELNLILSILP